MGASLKCAAQHCSGLVAGGVCRQCFRDMLHGRASMCASRSAWASRTIVLPQNGESPRVSKIRVRVFLCWGWAKRKRPVRVLLPMFGISESLQQTSRVPLLRNLRGLGARCAGVLSPSSRQARADSSTGRGPASGDGPPKKRPVRVFLSMFVISVSLLQTSRVPLLRNLPKKEPVGPGARRAGVLSPSSRQTRTDSSTDS